MFCQRSADRPSHARTALLIWRPSGYPEAMLRGQVDYLAIFTVYAERAKQYHGFHSRLVEAYLLYDLEVDAFALDPVIGSARATNCDDDNGRCLALVVLPLGALNGSL